MPPSSLRTGITSSRALRSAGASPKIIPVPSDNASVKASTRQSIGASNLIGRLGGFNANNAGAIQLARKKATHPPRNATSVLSISICRISRPRPAPSATRMAISRRRAVACANRRLAAFAQAISSTRPTTAISSPAKASTKPRRGAGTRVTGKAAASLSALDLG